MEFFLVGGDKQRVGAIRFRDFFRSGGELDFRCFDENEVEGNNEYSFSILLHACAINTKGFSFFNDEY